MSTAAITLKQIKSDVRHTFGLWNNEGYVKIPQAYIKHLANEAQNAILHSLSNNALMQISKNDRQDGITDTYNAIANLPDDMVRLVSVRINRVVAIIINPQEHRRIKGDPFLNGTLANPVCWIDDGKLNYVPNTACPNEIRYKYIPELTDYSADTGVGATSDLPASYHYLIALYVKAKVAEKLGLGDKAALFMTEFNGDITKINLQTKQQMKLSENLQE